jgi:hypothetical protein
MVSTFARDNLFSPERLIMSQQLDWEYVPLRHCLNKLALGMFPLKEHIDLFTYVFANADLEFKVRMLEDFYHVLSNHLRNTLIPKTKIKLFDYRDTCMFLMFLNDLKHFGIMLDIEELYDSFTSIDEGFKRAIEHNLGMCGHTYWIHI